jgi:hypothetical protein
LGQVDNDGNITSIAIDQVKEAVVALTPASLVAAVEESALPVEETAQETVEESAQVDAANNELDGMISGPANIVVADNDDDAADNSFTDVPEGPTDKDIANKAALNQQITSKVPQEASASTGVADENNKNKGGARKSKKVKKGGKANKSKKVRFHFTRKAKGKKTKANTKKRG